MTRIDPPADATGAWLAGFIASRDGTGGNCPPEYTGPDKRLWCQGYIDCGRTSFEARDRAESEHAAPPAKTEGPKMSNAETMAKSYIDRILRLKEEQDALGGDIREIYAEAKSQGFDKTAMGKAVQILRQREKRGAEAVSELDTLVSLYLGAYDGTPIALRAHTHAGEAE